MALTALICLYLVVAALGYLRRLGPLLARDLDVARIEWWRRRAPAALVAAMAMVLVAVGLAAYTTAYDDFVRPNALDYQTLATELAQAHLANARQLDLRLSCELDSPSPIISAEFGVPTTAISWAAEAMTRIELRDLDPARVHMAILVVPAHASLPPPPAGVVVIDARQLGRYSPRFSAETLRALGC